MDIYGTTPTLVEGNVFLEVDVDVRFSSGEVFGCWGAMIISYTAPVVILFMAYPEHRSDEIERKAMEKKYENVGEHTVTFDD